MARHRHLKTEDQDDPKMDISSMIDCCFLLLIYFLVATTLVSEKKLDISIPGDSSSSDTPPQVKPGKITLKNNGSVLWASENGDGVEVGSAYDPNAKKGSPNFSSQRRMPVLVDSLKDLKAQAESVDQKPIIVMAGAADAPHQRVVDIMAALAEAGIVTVGLNTTPTEE